MIAGPMRSATDSRESICVQNAVRCPRSEFAHLEEWLMELVVALAPDRPSLTVRLVGDVEMRRLNATFRAQNRSTDVLSFPGHADPRSPHLGDVAISVPTARRQAVAAGHSLSRELRVLALHGVLHCLGYDHEVDDGEMFDLERRLREDWILRRG